LFGSGFGGSSFLDLVGSDPDPNTFGSGSGIFIDDFKLKEKVIIKKLFLGLKFCVQLISKSSKCTGIYLLIHENYPPSQKHDISGFCSESCLNSSVGDPEPDPDP